MKLVPAVAAFKRPTVKRLYLPVSQVTMTLCKAGFQVQEFKHRVADATGIDKALSHRHIATAFAVDRFPR